MPATRSSTTLPKNAAVFAYVVRKIDFFILSFLGINFIGSSIYRKKAPHYLKFMPYFFLLNLLIEIIADFMMQGSANNLFLYHILTPIQYFFVSSIFYLYSRDRKIRQIIVFSNVIIVVFAIIFALTIQPVSENNSYENLLKNIFLLLLIFIYFRSLLVNEEYVDLSKSPIFLISSILFITILGNISIDLMLNFLMNSVWIDALYSSSLFLDIIVLLVYLFIYLRIALKNKVRRDEL